MFLSSVLLIASTLVLDASDWRAFAAGAPNCSLTTPPSSAGEILMHGGVSKVFPRLPDISKQYTGCQVLWVPGENHLELAAYVYFERGKPVIYYSPADGDEAELFCRYKRKRVIEGSVDDCPVADGLAVESMPAGCSEKLLASEGAIPECEYQ